MQEANRDYTWIGFIPMVGYHHVLMILIALAIILLCTPSPRASDILILGTNMNIFSSSSSATSWLLVILTTNTKHLLNILVLRKVHPHIWSRTGWSGRVNCHFKYCRRSPTRGSGGILWHLHPTRWWLIHLQPKCVRSSRYCQCWSGSLEPHLGCLNV